MLNLLGLHNIIQDMLNEFNAEVNKLLGYCDFKSPPHIIYRDNPFIEYTQVHEGVHYQLIISTTHGTMLQVFAYLNQFLPTTHKYYVWLSLLVDIGRDVHEGAATYYSLLKYYFDTDKKVLEVYNTLDTYYKRTMSEYEVLLAPISLVAKHRYIHEDQEICDLLARSALNMPFIDMETIEHTILVKEIFQPNIRLTKLLEQIRSKPKIINEWRRAIRKLQIEMLGDSISNIHKAIIKSKTLPDYERASINSKKYYDSVNEYLTNSVIESFPSMQILNETSRKDKTQAFINHVRDFFKSRGSSVFDKFIMQSIEKSSPSEQIEKLHSPVFSHEKNEMLDNIVDSSLSVDATNVPLDVFMSSMNRNLTSPRDYKLVVTLTCNINKKTLKWVDGSIVNYKDWILTALLILPHENKSYAKPFSTLIRNDELSSVVSIIDKMNTAWKLHSRHFNEFGVTLECPAISSPVFVYSNREGLNDIINRIESNRENKVYIYTNQIRCNADTLINYMVIEQESSNVFFIYRATDITRGMLFHKYQNDNSVIFESGDYFEGMSAIREFLYSVIYTTYCPLTSE